MFLPIKNKRAEGIIGDIIDQYTYADTSERPWIIGFSGGKDSTVLLTLVWIALRRIREDFPVPFQLRRPVYVVCNDTMVENPIISSYVDDVLEKIDIAAREQDLPVFVRKTTPSLEESFWVNVIGKGYPVPNNTFRWCTDKLKIRPTAAFLHEQLDKRGEAIVLLGTRHDEGHNRSQSIKKHEVKGSRLSRHPNSVNTYVFSPIKDLMLEEVWYIINGVKSPWGYDNSTLFQIYSDASADDYECPTVITNKKHTSCGQSRFGCWTCTVVKQDKSMSALIDNGQGWMTPLLEFRNWLQEGRNISENRSNTRRNGQNAVDENGHNFGNYTIHYRAQILRRLLQVQHQIQETKPQLTLISNQELIAIQVTWNREPDYPFEIFVSGIFQEIYGFGVTAHHLRSLSSIEKRILAEVCQDNMDYYHLVDNLLALQDSKSLLVSKYGLHNDIERRIEDFVKEGDQ